MHKKRMINGERLPERQVKNKLLRYINFGFKKKA